MLHVAYTKLCYSDRKRLVCRVYSCVGLFMVVFSHVKHSVSETLKKRTSDLVQIDCRG